MVKLLLEPPAQPAAAFRVAAPTPPKPRAQSEALATVPVAPKRATQRPGGSSITYSRTADGTAANPRSAAAARAASSIKLAHSMSQDESPFALCPDRPDFLLSLCTSSAATLSAGIPKGTAKADEWGFKWATLLCSKEHLNTQVIRPAVLTPEQEKAEEWLMAYAVMFFGLHMSPRRKRIASTGTHVGAIDKAKPTSALLAVYAWRRVLRDAGCMLVSMKQASLHLKGMLAEYKLSYGQDSLDVIHQEPLSNDVINACMDRLNFPIDGWSGQEREEMGCLMAYARLIGPRCDELTNELDYIREAWFIWCNASEGSS